MPSPLRPGSRFRVLGSSQREASAYAGCELPSRNYRDVISIARVSTSAQMATSGVDWMVGHLGPDQAASTASDLAWDAAMHGHAPEITKQVLCGHCVERHGGRSPGLLGYLACDPNGDVQLVTQRRVGKQERARRGNDAYILALNGPAPRSTARTVFRFINGVTLEGLSLMIGDGTGQEVKEAWTICESCGTRSAVNLAQLRDAAKACPGVLVSPRDRPRGTNRTVKVPVSRL